MQGVQGLRRKTAPRSSDRGRTNIHAEIAKIFFIAPLKLPCSGQQPRQTSVNDKISKNDSWHELTWLGLTATRISVMYRRKLERGFGSAGLRASLRVGV